MIYIFIGPDGAGKTTLAKKVAKKNNLEYYKFSNKEKDKVAKSYFMLTALGDKSVVFDRFYYPDEIIYNNALGKENKDNWLEIVNLLTEKEVTWIYVTASEQVLQERVMKRGDDYITSSDITRILKEYDCWLKHVKTLLPEHLILKINTDGWEYRLDV